MEISVQSGELIEALSERIASLTVELETTRLALRQAQDAIVSLEQQVTAFHAIHAPAPQPSGEQHPIL